MNGKVTREFHLPNGQEGCPVRKAWVNGRCIQVPMDKEVECDKLVADLLDGSDKQIKKANVNLNDENGRIKEN